MNIKQVSRVKDAQNKISAEKIFEIFFGEVGDFLFRVGRFSEFHRCYTWSQSQKQCKSMAQILYQNNRIIIFC